MINENFYIRKNEKLVLRILVFLAASIIVFGSWMFLARLSSASVASGNVSVESERKSIEHISGGIVSSIYVADGQHVVKGQPLVKVEDIPNETYLNKTRLSLINYRMQYQRLLAERDGNDYFEPNKFLNDKQINRDEIQSIVENQKALFHSRTSRVRSQIEILDSRIRQSERRIEVSNMMLHQNQLALGYLVDEINMHSKLLENGYTSKLQVLELMRNKALLNSDIISMQTSVESAQATLLETMRQKDALISESQAEIESSISAINEQILSTASELSRLNDIQSKTIIRSPSAGVVLGLTINSQGDIIKPGEPIMEIVPTLDELLVETLINPKDIDSVHEGLVAQVRLTSFDARTTPIIHGKVVFVAADTTVIQHGQNSLNGYKVKIKLDKTELDRNPQIDLYPGMPAEVYVILKERRPIDYLLDPLFESFFRAFRES